MSVWLTIIYLVVAVFGRILGHSLSARTELANRNRQYRLERLAEAWRSIQQASSGTDEAARRGLEGALRDVELFGTPSQVGAAARVVTALDEGSEDASALRELLEAIRADLRQQMHLGLRVAPLAPAAKAAPAKPCASSPVRVVVGPRAHPRAAA